MNEQNPVPVDQPLRILVPYDCGPASNKALGWAAELQQVARAVSVHVLHVVDQTHLTRSNRRCRLW